MGGRHYWSLIRICKKTSDILHLHLWPPATRLIIQLWGWYCLFTQHMRYMTSLTMYTSLDILMWCVLYRAIYASSPRHRYEDDPGSPSQRRAEHEVQDLTLQSHLTEQGIVDILQARFDKDKIYVNIHHYTLLHLSRHAFICRGP